MEKYRIGTDGSIAKHIEKISKRNYGRRVVPTKLGVALIHGYWRIGRDLVDPQLRGWMEDEMKMMASGRKNVVERILKIYLDKFEFFMESIGAMGELFRCCCTPRKDRDENGKENGERPSAQPKMNTSVYGPGRVPGRGMPIRMDGGDGPRAPGREIPVRNGGGLGLGRGMVPGKGDW